MTLYERLALLLLIDNEGAKEFVIILKNLTHMCRKFYNIYCTGMQYEQYKTKQTRTRKQVSTRYSSTNDDTD